MFLAEITNRHPYRYTINTMQIKQKSHHKDLGIIFSNDLHWYERYNNVTTKAYQTLGLLRRTFKLNSPVAKKHLYISLVRSQLLYCSQIWKPQFLKDISTLERIQRRATKCILNNYELSYKSHLQQLHLLPLMYIYELNDILFLLKSLKSPSDNFDIRQFVQFTSNSTRSGSSYKLVHLKPATSVHQNFYFTRIVRLWNYLPSIDLSLSIHLTKNHLTKYFWKKFNDDFNSDNICSFHVLCPCYRCSSQPIITNFHPLSSYS